jgi:ketosteroid isomerase-like protein
MPPSNTEIIRDGFAYFRATRKPAPQILAPKFVWDMSTFRGWPEQQLYEGADGSERFLAAWLAAWDDWVLEAESYHEAGDMVVAVMHQHGRSKASGLEVDMHFAMVWTMRDGLTTRMQMYADPAEAFEAVGLEVP